MPSQGPNFAGAVQLNGGGFWTNPTDIESNGGAAAVATFALVANAASNPIAGGTHGFSIPAGSTINGIQVFFETIFQAGGGGMKTDHIKIWKGGAAAGTSKSGSGRQWTPTVLTQETYGSSSDLWGTTWLASDINAAGFGFEMAVLETGGFSNDVAGVNGFQITVTYTPPFGRTSVSALFGF